MGCWSREDNQVRTVAPAKALDEAVYLQYACKHYGPNTGSKRKDVLIDLEMTVPRGTIYGLLGASGCGKTTLLSCVVGRRHLTSGEIWVLGGKPGTPGSGVPGPRIGYMPQEIALVGEFTVKEAVYYFASICGMQKKQMKERFRFLSNLLELPPDNRYVKNCSGGQQRRVSFAAAMVHDPELLILDEPTVGLDPVLRDKIWEHLVEIAVSKNIAVIITTHYIEETRQAHSIGLMRNGKLLAEESPDYLMTLFKKETLEDVFLVLSEKQNKGEPVLEFQSEEHLAHKDNKTNSFDVKPNSSSENNLNEKVDAGCQTYQQIEVHNLRRSRIKALLKKNVTQILRNPSGIFFCLFFPVLQIVTFFSAVGGDPRNLKVAIVNEESNWTECSKYISYYPTVKYTEYNHSCNMNMLSCRFLNELNDTVAEKVFYGDLESGLEAVRKGKVVGVLYFAENFTEASVAVRDYGRRVRDIDLNNSQVTVWMDMSNRQIGTILSYNLLDRYIQYYKRILKDCHDIPKLGDIPVRIEEPIYGKKHERFTIFMSPGVVLTMIFFLATLITSTIIIGDRLEGIWDRTLVAGVTAGDVMFTHIITQFVIVLIQAAEIVFATLYIFNVECRGSVITVVSLILLQGLAGMCYGFLISVVCSTYIMACYASTGSFYPMILICGVVWPLEGMPKVLQAIAKFMPFTLPIFSLRNIMAKGWDITNVEVYDGFLVTVAWIVIFCVISYFGIKKSI